MIGLISIKEDKSIDKKLTNFLENNSFKIWNKWRDSTTSPFEEFKDRANEMEAVIFIISNNSLVNPQFKKYFAFALENNLNIVLFITSKIDTNNLPNWFFLEQNDYVNSYEVNFNVAAEALKSLINEIITESKSTPANTEQHAALQTNNTKSQVNKWLIAVIVILALALIFFLVKRPSDIAGQGGIQVQPASGQSTGANISEDLLLGSWTLVDYKDNIPRTGQDLQAFNNEINRLKKEFLLTFNANHTFVRRGFAPQPETGTWSLDKQTKTLILTPLNQSNGDKLKILTLTANTLIFEVASPDPALGTIIVRFTLQKQM